MAFHSWAKLLNHVIFLLQLSLKLFHVHTTHLGCVSGLTLADDLLVNFVLTDDLLHLGQGSVSSKGNLLTKLSDSLRVDLSLLAHLHTHLCDLLFFRPNGSILIVKHLLQRLNRLVSSISHLFLLLIAYLRCFGSVLRDSILKYFVLG